MSSCVAGQTGPVCQRCRASVCRPCRSPRFRLTSRSVPFTSKPSIEGREEQVDVRAPTSTPLAARPSPLLRSGADAHIPTAAKHRPVKQDASTGGIFKSDELRAQNLPKARWFRPERSPKSPKLARAMTISYSRSALLRFGPTLPSRPDIGGGAAKQGIQQASLSGIAGH